MIDKFIKKVFDINAENFEEIALEVFNFQAVNNPVYQEFLRVLRVNPNNIIQLSQIPFLPISFFKTHKILIKNLNHKMIFESSGTSGDQTSKHYIYDVEIYRKSLINTFNMFYGDVENYTILALLPSYLERKHSSLIFMVDELMKMTNSKDSGFYLDEWDILNDKLVKLIKRKQRVIFIGVSFALLDFSELYQPDLSDIIVMETGGMKGRGIEIPRDQLHEILKSRFKVKNIHSEYGMTELLSQAYSSGDGIFKTCPWMKVMIRNQYDPFEILQNNEPGLINIIDLANIGSCSFIATDDVGLCLSDESFKVLGRSDIAPVRGCNLLYT